MALKKSLFSLGSLLLLGLATTVASADGGKSVDQVIAKARSNGKTKAAPKLTIRAAAHDQSLDADEAEPAEEGVAKRKPVRKVVRRKTAESKEQLVNHQEGLEDLDANEQFVTQEELPQPMALNNQEGHAQGQDGTVHDGTLHDGALHDGTYLHGDGACCGDTGCGGCCNTGCCGDGFWHGIGRHCCNAGFIAGAEAIFLTPFGDPHPTVTLSNLVTNRQYHGSSGQGLGAGGRFWFGVQRQGWGVRARYTTFGSDTVDLTPAVPVNAPPAFIEASHVAANYVDIELTQRYCFGCYNLNSSFGARWARLERNSSVVGYGTVGDVNLLGLAMGANKIEGAGFTASLGATSPLHIGCWAPCGWYTFWNARGSLLWADSTTSALAEANAVFKGTPAVAAANSQNKAFASKDHSENVFIAEAQLGIGYRKQLCCLPACFFFSAAIEYQHWRTGDLTAQAESFAFLAGGPPLFGGQVNASVNSHDGDLDLLGAVIGAGITY